MKNNLKQIRKIKGITQKQLADSLGISKAMISMWENNPKEKIPTLRVKQISEYLNIEESELHTTDLDIKTIKRNALQEEIERLEQLHRATSEFRNEIVVGELKESHKKIENEILKIGDDLDKLVQIIRFLELVNVFDEFIHTYSFNTLLERLFKLLEENDVAKLDILLKVVTYLTLENKYATQETKIDLFNEDDDFNLKFKEFLEVYNSEI
ncbi:helix-turn-helix transcriptional regulator [Peribacillus sp. NPDC097197]|uniref:helix-turn-helix transcriptional regulator n=1 Tax=Peribacillus sp. NPDC097197 TaxID=3390615 RepID=UPI003CFFBE69